MSAGRPRPPRYTPALVRRYAAVNHGWTRGLWHGCTRPTGTVVRALMADATEAEMADRDGGDHAADAPVGPDARALLLKLITAELGATWDAAIEAGADPARLAEIVEERRRRIEAATPTTDDRGA